MQIFEKNAVFPFFLSFCSKTKPSLFFFFFKYEIPSFFWLPNHILRNSMKNFFFQDFCLNSVLRPPFSFSWPIELHCLLFYMKHAGSLKKNSPEDSAIHRAYVENKRDKYIDAGVVFLAYVLRIKISIKTSN